MNRTTPTTTKIGLEVTNSTLLPSLEVTNSTTLPNSTTEPAGGGGFDGVVTKTHVGVIVACGVGGLLLLVCFIIYYRYKTITTRKRRFLRLTTGRPNYQEAARELTLPKNETFAQEAHHHESSSKRVNDRSRIGLCAGSEQQKMEKLGILSI